MYTHTGNVLNLYIECGILSSTQPPPHQHIRAKTEPFISKYPSSAEMSRQPYVFPPFPSPQVKAVQEYLKHISEFDIDSLGGLLTDDFTLLVSPANLGVPKKTRAEEFHFIKAMRASLDGKPLVVSRAQTWRGHPFGTDRQLLLDRSQCTMSTMDRGRLGSMYRIFQNAQTRY